MLDLSDTIVALASARGGSLRGILRLSGPNARELVGRTFSPELPEFKAGFRRRSITGCLSFSPLNSTVPATLFLSRAPHSYTGEDLIEVHTIGCTPILELALSTYLAAGARQAVPGEFTMRAFLNGKLDLTAAEAILCLIDATSDRQANIALAQLAGGIARPIQTLRDQLLDLLAELEAGLDFAEEDLELIDRTRLLATLENANRQLTELGRQMSDRTVVVDRARVILAGRPNVGKSSLFNALLGRDAALVSSAAGTTRDYLVAPLCLSSCTVELVDTAGLEHALDAIGRSAQAAREQATASADLILWCNDDQSDACGGIDVLKEIANAAVLLVQTKSDLKRIGGSVRDHGTEADSRSSYRSIGIVSVSARTGAGLSRLLRAIEDWLRGNDGGEGGVVANTAARCRQSIDAAAHAVLSAREHVKAGSSDELTALELRLALDELGQVVGAVYTDDVLDRVFSRFCIGK